MQPAAGCRTTPVPLARTGTAATPSPTPAQQVLDARTGDPWIVSDLLADPFYRFLHRTYPLWSTLQVCAPASTPVCGGRLRTTLAPSRAAALAGGTAHREALPGTLRPRRAAHCLCVPRQNKLSASSPAHPAGTWPLQYAALYWLGGWPALVWGGAVRQVGCRRTP